MILPDPWNASPTTPWNNSNPDDRRPMPSVLRQRRRPYQDGPGQHPARVVEVAVSADTGIQNGSTVPVGHLDCVGQANDLSPQGLPGGR